MNWLRRQHPFNLYLALLVVFVLVRFLFVAITTAGEYRLYKDYGDAARNTSLDELYRCRALRRGLGRDGFKPEREWRRTRTGAQRPLRP